MWWLRRWWCGWGCCGDSSEVFGTFDDGGDTGRAAFDKCWSAAADAAVLAGDCTRTGDVTDIFPDPDPGDDDVISVFAKLTSLSDTLDGVTVFFSELDGAISKKTRSGD